jgi:hypothetical protein
MVPSPYREALSCRASGAGLNDWSYSTGIIELALLDWCECLYCKLRAIIGIGSDGRQNRSFSAKQPFNQCSDSNKICRCGGLTLPQCELALP